MKIRPLICMPEPPFMGKSPSKKGYCGFIRDRGDYESEKDRVIGTLTRLVNGLKGKGYDIELLSPVDLPPNSEYIRTYKLFPEIRKASLNVIFPFAFPGLSIKAAASASDYVVIFDSYKPMYAGTLFSPPLVKEYERYGFRTVFTVEGDWARIKRIIKVTYVLDEIERSRLLVVGPINKTRGLNAFKRSMELFKFRPTFYTYDEFVRLFERLWKSEKTRAKATELVKRLTSKATKVVEPDEEKLARAATYHLALKELVKENGANWVHKCRL